LQIVKLACKSQADLQIVMTKSGHQKGQSGIEN
jgi:hypothetical protein